ncbi:MAG: hypothetical protein WCK98_04165 [bacterium]
MFNTLYTKRTHIIKHWILPTILLTLVFVTILATAQSVIRTESNEELYTKGVDYRTVLQSGQPSNQLKSLEAVDPYESLSAIVVLYDVNQNVLGSNIVKSREVPKIPSGVLDYARSNNVNRVTWQPYSDLRLSAVAYKVSGNFNGFVVVAKNQEYTNARINIISKYVGVAWIASLVILLFINTLKDEKNEEKKEVEVKAEAKKTVISSPKKIEVLEKINTKSKIVKSLKSEKISKPQTVKKSVAIKTGRAN